MALKFQYNKTFLNQLNKGLKVRLNALPTLKAKEAALRFEVKSEKDEYKDLENQLAQRKQILTKEFRLWKEFPEGIVKADQVELTDRKIAGIRTPNLIGIDFSIQDVSVFNEPGWLLPGIELLKELTILTVKMRLAQHNIEVLEYARKKTTQKVNLYEKVQIPEYQRALLKIKRFLEDKDNLSKASQKILKIRLAALEEEEEELEEASA